MPAKKPSSLIRRHDANDERESRVNAESSMEPITELTGKLPTALYNHPTAQKIWKRTIGLFGEIDGKIVTAFDEGILIDYCLICEELLDDIPVLYAGLLEDYKQIRALVEAVEEAEPRIRMLMQLQGIIKEIKGLDARRDVKRKLAHTLRQSLYLTPRSRAGVAPPEKEPELKDDMSELLKGE